MSATTVDWDAVGERGFWAAERAAKSVANSYSAIEEDDVFQEAVIYIATHPREMEEQFAYGESLPGVRGGELGGLKSMARQLVSRMRAWAASQLDRRDREFDAAIERHQEEIREGFRHQPTPAAFEGMPYTPGLIETILPALWTPSLAWAPVIEGGPEEDMPRAKSDPSHSGTHMAHYADVRAAWTHASLSLRQRQVLLLLHGAGLTQNEVAERLGMSQPTVSRYATAGLCNLATHLNGEEIALDDVDLAA